MLREFEFEVLKERGDTERLRFLYSLSPQSKRKEDADEALVFWRRSLAGFCQTQGTTLGFTAREAHSAFAVSFFNEHWCSNEELIPTYLDQVIESLVREQKLVTRSFFSLRESGSAVTTSFLQGWGQCCPFLPPSSPPAPHM